MNTLDINNITDKASYLAFRAEWKETYRTLSNAIREQKLAERALTSHQSINRLNARRVQSQADSLSIHTTGAYAVTPIASRFAGTAEEWQQRLDVANSTIRSIAVQAMGNGAYANNPSAMATELIERRKQSKVLAGQRRAAELITAEAA